MLSPAAAVVSCLGVMWCIQQGQWRVIGEWSLCPDPTCGIVVLPAVSVKKGLFVCVLKYLVVQSTDRCHGLLLLVLQAAVLLFVSDCLQVWYKEGCLRVGQQRAGESCPALCCRMHVVEQAWPASRNAEAQCFQALRPGHSCVCVCVINKQPTLWAGPRVMSFKCTCVGGWKGLSLFYRLLLPELVCVQRSVVDSPDLPVREFVG